MREELWDKLLSAAQAVVNDADLSESSNYTVFTVGESVMDDLKMAVEAIHDDAVATIESYSTHGLDWNRNVKTVSTYFRGMFDDIPWSFEETVARLITRSGQRGTDAGDQYKVSVKFVGTYRGETFTLYDYKEDRAIHIGGFSGLDAAGLVNALLHSLASVEPTPYHAKEYYDREVGHEWPLEKGGKAK